MKTIYKKLVVIFLLSFLMNLVWETLHMRFYSYAYIPNNPVSLFAIVLSTFADAIYVTLVGLIFLKNKYLKEKVYLALFIGIIFAILWEIIFLKIGLWAYNEKMPVIPFINTGLSPSIQLGLTSYLTFIIISLNKPKI